jgi:hypothetical protein
MNQALRDELIAMEAHDQSVRAELAADGSLFEGYHPRMESLHRANAARLREIIALVGWPGESLVGPAGAQAAWRIAQHSIGEPDFMRASRKLLDEAIARGDAPRWQFAFIDDRIRVFEGKPQRYGTQLRGGPDGLEPYVLENPDRVEEWRLAVGLPSLTEIMVSDRREPPVGARDQADKDARELEWRREVGWIT